MTQENNCDLINRKCVPCQGGIEPLKGADLAALAAQLPAGWQIINEHQLEKTFKFKNFKLALDFVNKVGALAEEIGHHPDINFGWGRAKLTLWTHKINGLHTNDFIFAAKADSLYQY
ncbi:MAG: 4a-hydroxytetrahydrobiopterin dehydratase [Phycisphaerae bacterium]